MKNNTIVFEFEGKNYRVDAVVLEQVMPIFLPGGRLVSVQSWGEVVDGVYRPTKVETLDAMDLEDFGGHDMAEATLIP